jgi:hypothetical protein
VFGLVSDPLPYAPAIGPLPRGPVGTRRPHANDPRQRAMRQANPAHLDLPSPGTTMS